MTSGDWLPPQAPFDVVRRGFSTDQVTAHLERLEYDLRITTADRDATNQRLRELGGQLAAAQGEADMLRAQLDRSALDPVSMSNLSDRMQRMIRLAEEEAGEIRARSEADADRLRGQLEQSLAETAAARAAFDAERERTRKQLAEQVHGLIAEASTEAEETRAAAEQESTHLLQEANGEAERTVLQAGAHAQQMVDDAHRAAQQELAAAAAEAERTITAANAAAEQTVSTANAHAEQTVSTANAAAAQRVSAANAEAEQTITAANEAATALTAQTAAERERLDAQSQTRRIEIEEDFEIAIAAKRADAARVIAEREADSDATARTLVADATAHSQELVATGTAQSEQLIAQATTYANALVNRAAAESHRRIEDADEALKALTGLREQLVAQLQSLSGHLDHIRTLAGSAPSMLTPPAEEARRPVAEDFPADPAQRPTEVDVPMPELDAGLTAANTNGSVPAGEPALEGNVSGAYLEDQPAPVQLAPAPAESTGEAVAAPAAPEPASGHRFRNRGGRPR